MITNKRLLMCEEVIQLRDILKIDELNVGQTASFSKTISESDVYMYAGITGDFNPSHVNG